jgi:hypothetical protein
MRAALLAAAALAFAFTLAWAHPAIEGGIKTGFAAVKGIVGGHIEILADPRAGQIRIYLSEAQDEKLPNGKDHEWVIPMTVRRQKVGGEETNVLPVRDPGAGNEWFPVAPVESRGGYVFYRIEATGKVMLDGDANRRQALTFAAGKDARGTACLVAAVDLAKAQTIRFEEIKVSIVDAARAKPAWEKVYFTGGWGLGKLHSNLNQTDLSLKAFADSLAKAAEMDKFRKPQAPALGSEKSKR